MFCEIPLFLQPRKGKDGAVAQSVEQRTENPCVAGSIPAHTTTSKEIFERRSLFLFVPGLLYE
jgi:hypothetical protein